MTVGVRRGTQRAPAAVAVAVALCSAVGCVSVTPKGFGAKAPYITPAKGSVSVSARLVDSPASRFNANGMAFDVDRNRFSEELAQLLEESLARAGVDTNGARRLEVQVDYIDFMFQGPCILDYRVIFDGRETLGLQSLGDSSNFAFACRSAVEAAVQDIASHKRTIEFLKGE